MDIAFGTTGEVPTHVQKEAVLYWLVNWSARKGELKDFMSSESIRWKPSSLPNSWRCNGLPDVEALTLSAFVQPDSLSPEKITIYLSIPGEDHRQFYLLMENELPIGCGFDDS